MGFASGVRKRLLSKVPTRETLFGGDVPVAGVQGFSGSAYGTVTIVGLSHLRFPGQHRSANSGRVRNQVAACTEAPRAATPSGSSPPRVYPGDEDPTVPPKLLR